MLAELLRPCFRIVAQCKDGDAAFKAIKEFSPRLGILDIAMPKINGLEVGRRLMAVHSSTKIVSLTLESDAYRRGAMLWTRICVQNAGLL
jgi:DNA-binding NarL/FixJ family response regulator